ncbi:MAG TPA: hypothetical protein P5069_09710, partial [Candidatus Hydrogenedentes bacterium]|nr:hypothetical protein [Candidatus Hydrogenedentota bacterium]
KSGGGGGGGGGGGEEVKSQVLKVLSGIPVNNLELQEAVFDVLVRGYAEPKDGNNDEEVNIPLGQSNGPKNKYAKEVLYRARLRITYGIQLAGLTIESPSIPSNRMVVVLDEPSILSSKTLTTGGSDKKIGILAVKGEGYMSGSVPRGDLDHKIESYLVKNSSVIGDKLMSELIPSMKVQSEEILCSLLNPILNDAGMELEIKWNNAPKLYKEDMSLPRAIELPVEKEISQ